MSDDPKATPRDRMMWLLCRLSNRTWFPSGFIVAWDEQFVDAFMLTFPESATAARHYTLGSSSVPMLNRAAKLAESLGYLEAGHVGNQDARSYNQRTWCRCWTLTPRGRAVAEEMIATEKETDR